MALPLDRRRAACTARATSARRSTRTGTRSTPTPTTTSRACRSSASSTGSASRSRSASRCPAATCSRPSGSSRSAGCPVLLLDTDVPDNDDSDRPITHILYVRGREMRLHQELVLGVGGVRALRALGLDPAVWHLNEGHSAFLLAERARELVAAGRSARRRVRPRSGATACSRSTPRSPRATSASTPTSCAGSPVRCSTATGGRARAASRSSGSWSLGLGVDERPVASST